jgi:outer membrane receptor protein involved in Fe transport
MLYARAAQGFRPGGPNALSPVAIAAGADTVYDSESLTNYEVGVKTSFFDNNLYAELTGFYIDWDDIQIRQVTGGFAFTANGSKARSKGVELTLTAKPTDGLDLNFNLGYTNAELVDDAPSVGGVKGDELPNAPKLTLGAMGNYAFSINSDYTANVGLSWRHVDDRLSDFSAERLVLEAYDTVGLHAGLSFNNLQFQLYVKNLTNERGVDSVSTYFGRASVSRPRLIGASVTVRY